MRARAVVLAVAIFLAPLGARAADLVVWWEKGHYAEPDEAVQEIIAAFEQRSGKQVELVFYPIMKFRASSWRPSRLGQLPDFAFGNQLENYIAQRTPAFPRFLASKAPCNGRYGMGTRLEEWGGVGPVNG